MNLKYNKNYNKIINNELFCLYNKRNLFDNKFLLELFLIQ